MTACRMPRALGLRALNGPVAGLAARAHRPLQRPASARALQGVFRLS